MFRFINTAPRAPGASAPRRVYPVEVVPSPFKMAFEMRLRRHARLKSGRCVHLAAPSDFEVAESVWSWPMSCTTASGGLMRGYRRRMVSAGAGVVLLATVPAVTPGAPARHQTRSASRLDELRGRSASGRAGSRSRYRRVFANNAKARVAASTCVCSTQRGSLKMGSSRSSRASQHAWRPGRSGVASSTFVGASELPGELDYPVESSGPAGRRSAQRLERVGVPFARMTVTDVEQSLMGATTRRARVSVDVRVEQAESAEEAP